MQSAWVLEKLVDALGWFVPMKRPLKTQVAEPGRLVTLSFLSPFRKIKTFSKKNYKLASLFVLWLLNVSGCTQAVENFLIRYRIFMRYESWFQLGKWRHNAEFPVDYHFWLLLCQSYVTRIITTNFKTEDYGVINIRFNCIVCVFYGILFYSFFFWPQNDSTVPGKTFQSDRVPKAG